MREVFFVRPFSRSGKILGWLKCNVSPRDLPAIRNPTRLPGQLRAEILISNSWLVRARINRRSLRVSPAPLRVPAVLSWSSTFLIACHSAFKLLRRGPCCEREREKRCSIAVDRPCSACGQALHAKRQTHARGGAFATKGTTGVSVPWRAERARRGG